MNGDGGIAHQRFRPGGGDFQPTILGAGHLIAHVVELAALRLHDDLLIAEGGEANGTPVYHALAPVDQAGFEQVDKDPGDPAASRLDPW